MNDDTTFWDHKGQFALLSIDGFCLRVTDCKMGLRVTALDELRVGEHLSIINMVWASTMCQVTLCFFYMFHGRKQTFSDIQEHAAWVNNIAAWEEVVRAMIWQMILNCGLNDEPLLASEVRKENHSRQRTNNALWKGNLLWEAMEGPFWLWEVERQPNGSQGQPRKHTVLIPHFPESNEKSLVDFKCEGHKMWPA